MHNVLVLTLYMIWTLSFGLIYKDPVLKKNQFQLDQPLFDNIWVSQITVIIPKIASQVKIVLNSHLAKCAKTSHPSCSSQNTNKQMSRDQVQEPMASRHLGNKFGHRSVGVWMVYSVRTQYQFGPWPLENFLTFLLLTRRRGTTITALLLGRVERLQQH